MVVRIFKFVMEKHLKDQQEYIDQYDRMTVEHCRRMDVLLSDSDSDSVDGEEFSKKQKEAIQKEAHKLFMFYERGERYLNKEKTIREWMERDRQKDELYETAQAPENIRCLTCRNRMTPTFKELWANMDKKDRVLFMYDCPNKCLPRRAFFSDGEEFRSEPNLCPTCGEDLRISSNNDGIKLVTTYSCQKCGYSKTDEYTWSKNKEIDVNFAKDRNRYCMTERRGERISRR
jgi:ribosomal protein S27AE